MSCIKLRFRYQVDNIMTILDDSEYGDVRFFNTSRLRTGQREGVATPENIFSSTLPNQFIARAGEAPAEPKRRQLGRSLALPLFFKRLGIAKMFTGVG